MPRAKVKPEDRQRSVKACQPCKTSKTRCDAESPCAACVKRGRIHACIYPTPSARGHVRSQSTSTEASSLPRQDLPQQRPLPSLDEARPSLSPAVPNDKAAAADADPPRAKWTPSSSQRTRSRMLLSSRGEKLYVGETASLSFLQFLRKTLRRHMGPSPFTESEFSNQMLEVDQGDRLLDVAEPDGLEDQDQKRALVQCFFEASSAILHLYTKDEAFGFVTDTGLSPSTNHFSDRAKRDDHAALCLMLAIGAQCRGSRQSDAEYATRCFSRGQQIAFEGMLCNPSINMIRLFLLMAFYMLGACHRNAAFIYIGVASKAASALGLHVKEVYKHVQDNELDTRIRTWKSLRNLDLIVTSILGRAGGPSMVSPAETDLSNNVQVSGHRSLDATYRVCTIIDDLQQEFAKGGIADLKSAEDYLQRLREWSQSVPPELRQFTSANAINTDSEHVIGAVHISCCYFFGAILVTRPFLISHLMSKIRGTGADTPHPAAASGDRDKVSKLANACLNSAIYMSQTGYQAMESGYLLGNMCLLKAWMFAAGLLLGFALFAESGENTEVEEAFKNAIAVLKMIAVLSPQAGHYTDILTKFSEAVQQYKRKLKEERRRATNEYVDQIFAIDLGQPQGYPSPVSGNCDNGPATSNSMNEVSFPPDMLPGGPLGDPSPNDLSLDWQPFGMFFEDFWVNQQGGSGVMPFG